MADVKDRALDWDEEITGSDEKEYTVLEPGEYDYEVVAFDRGRFDGSAKMRPCPIAKLELKCSDGEQKSIVFVNLFLNEKSKWKLEEFFKSCGLLDPSTSSKDSYKMPWSKVMGACGRCRIKNREYNDNTYNDVAKFIVDKGNGSTKSTKKTFKEL